jgi:hypothetical protein
VIYAYTVRRLLSITLLLLFGLPMVAPLFALGVTAESGLRACCRRVGAHHCVMTSAERVSTFERGSEAGAPSEKCPYFPNAAVLDVHTPFAFAHLAAASVMAVNCSAVFFPTQRTLRISRDGSPQKRGPPAVTLL